MNKLGCRLFGHRWLPPTYESGTFISEWVWPNAPVGVRPCVTAYWACARCGGLRHFTRDSETGAELPSAGVPSL